MQCTNKNWDMIKNSYTLLIVGDMCVDLKSGLCLKVIKQSFKNQMLRLTKYLENKKATIKLSRGEICVTNLKAPLQMV